MMERDEISCLLWKMEVTAMQGQGLENIMSGKFIGLRIRRPRL